MPTAPPSDIKLSPISSTSLSISWNPPPPFHRNGIITGYEVCFAWVKSSENCDRIIKTKERDFRLGFLSSATKYKVKVLARNEKGRGNYSEEYIQITNSGDNDGDVNVVIVSYCKKFDSQLLHPHCV